MPKEGVGGLNEDLRNEFEINRPGATCNITLTFTPLAKGKRSAKIDVSETVPGRPQAISLSGNGHRRNSYD